VGCLSIVALGVASIAGLVGWIGWKGSAARRHAEQLCAAFQLGADAQPFERRASDLGLQSWPAMPVTDHAEGDVTVQSASDGVMLARWFCTIEVKAGRVLTAKVTLVD
jgi:hypothetical protein